VIIRVLGSAAGGGFPQWNCNCSNCAGVRAGSLRATRRTQSSIAISTDRRQWVLCNASPDIHQQIAATLAPPVGASLRETPIAATILVDSQIDHCAGLLLLRENRAPLQVWTTDAVREDLGAAFPVLRLLEHYCGVDWQRIRPGSEWFAIPALVGVDIQALAVPGKPGPYSAHRGSPRTGDNVALVFRDRASGRQALYAPGLQAMTGELSQALGSSACAFLDGTFWSDDEMIELGASSKTAQSMGHLPQSGPGGMIEAMDRVPRTTRRILIHINNTNPILNEAGAERALLDAAGIEVAFDGMEITL
jgi:pyrroloquinoline quinone biosynthesis protein B